MKSVEKEVTIQSKVVLKGTLTFPENRAEKSPAILIIAGSGNLDRDGKVNEKLNLRLYGQLAEALTGMGYITLRYDKRGVGASEGNYLAAGLWDFVDDARAAIQFLKSLPEVDPSKVILLGHSEGATIGTAVAAREELGGVILLSGAGERLDEATKRQRDLAAHDIMNAKGFQGTLLRLLGTHKKVETQAQKQMSKILNSTEDTIKYSFVKVNAKWWREHFAYNVREDLPNISCPVLAITGALDIQANPAVLKDLPKYVKQDAEYYVVDHMGHSCKYITKASSMLEAKKDILAEAKLPVHPELLKLLEDWLSRHFISESEELLVK